MNKSERIEDRINFITEQLFDLKNIRLQACENEAMTMIITEIVNNTNTDEIDDVIDEDVFNIIQSEENPVEMIIWTLKQRLVIGI